MKLFKGMLTVFLLLFLGVTKSGATQKPNQDDAIALLTRANESVSIKSEGPFLIKISVKYEWDRLVHVGEYQLFWMNENKWREQIDVGEYQERRIGGEGQIWQQFKNPQYRFIGDQVRELINFESNLKLKAGESVSSVSEKMQENEKHTCIKIQIPKSDGREVCLQADSGEVLRTNKSQRLSDFRQFKKKMFPFSMGQGSEIDLRVLELSAVKEFEPDFFTPPQNLIGIPGCYLKEPPQLVNRVAPTYPGAARMAPITGQVQMLATISREGKVQRVDLVRGHPLLVESVEVAIRQSKYQPATCNGTPVEGTKFYVSTFTMSR